MRVYFCRISSMLGYRENHAEADLYCVRNMIDRQAKDGDPDYVDVPDATAHRWYHASAELLSTVRTNDRKLVRAYWHWWRSSDRTWRRVDKRLTAAYSRFCERAGDLTERVEAEWPAIVQRREQAQRLRDEADRQRLQEMQERQRIEQEQRARQEREIREHAERMEAERRALRAEQDRKNREQRITRAEVMARAHAGPEWGYQLNASRSQMAVHLIALDPVRPGPDNLPSDSGLRIDEVLSVLDEVRAERPGTAVTCPYQTRIALLEWHQPAKPAASYQAVDDAWWALTGHTAQPPRTGRHGSNPVSTGGSSHHYDFGAGFGGTPSF